MRVPADQSRQSRLFLEAVGEFRFEGHVGKRGRDNIVNAIGRACD